MSEPTHTDPVTSTAKDYDAVIVGAGFAGLHMLYRLRKLGLKVRVFEAGGGVGGTWYWNRYPGARCDAVSVEYSYQFSEDLQQEWEWSEIYASQPEILRYLNHVADRFDLRPDIQLNTRVNAMHFDDASGLWRVKTENESVSAKFCIMASGCLSSVNTPAIKGLDNFEGRTYHTGRWPHEDVDFSGREVGIIGTGSSAIQAIPVIAAKAKHLFVFQRTANYTVPAQNGPQDPENLQRIKSDYKGFRKKNRQLAFGNDFRHNDVESLKVSEEERQREYEERWQSGGLPFLASFNDLLFNHEANETAAEFIRAKIRSTVNDQATAELLCPQTVLGCKRLCVDTRYFETYNRSNVTLVSIKDSPIEEITAKGLIVKGTHYQLDDLVLATGFDAMTGTLLKIDIVGKSGATLKQKWKNGPSNYLGLCIADFPNFFNITGPGSPSVLSNMVPSIEQHVDWIAKCVDYVNENNFRTIEATEEAEEAWVQHVNEVAAPTLFTACNSWYLGANIPGKPRVFMPYIGVPPYVEKCNDVAAKDYEGFVLS
ncbi:MAG: cation diffusion facilitator CzcD-associated flavoprotein CzcO [Gammaproteobacteria bacterium]|jgi:cation diffusion facilitator CzcD-associated flavoprotein CzcO